MDESSPIAAQPHAQLPAASPAIESPVQLGRGRSGLVLKISRDEWVAAAGLGGTAGPPHGGSSDLPSSASTRLASEPARRLRCSPNITTSQQPGANSQLAVKIFRGEALARLVHLLLSGAPNPYTWNEDAVRCAVLRRELLADLVEVWFGGRLQVAKAAGMRWNDEYRAFELAAEFVDGRTATLHHPFSAWREDELPELVDQVMRPLQRHLEAAGFDGLVWQAGKGNPVAANNFLLCDEPNDGPSSGSSRRWTWIDLESGVPALFPINPWSLLTFYLPRSWRHGRPLFDDVDVARLRDYLDRHSLAIHAQLGPDRLADMRRRTDELADRQRRWKRLSRLDRSIAYQLSQGRITADRARWYARRPLRWYARETIRAGVTALGRSRELARRTVRWLSTIDLGKWIGDLCRALTSQTYRAELARKYVSSRIDRWQQRRQLTWAESACLRRQLGSGQASSYLTDFGMHLAIKVPMKILVYGVIVPLAAAGLIDPLLAGALLLGAGPLGRTVYTLIRLAEAVVHRVEKPWVSLFIGLLPVVGNVAYPMQVLYASASRHSKLAQFIVCDATTRLGEHLPIWGGPDTQTEHFFSRLADLVVPNREPIDDDDEVAMDEAATSDSSETSVMAA